MALNKSNIIEGSCPSDDPGNEHLSPKQSKELDKQARKVDKALGQAASSRVQAELLDYILGEVERLKVLHEDKPWIHG